MSFLTSKTGERKMNFESEALWSALVMMRSRAPVGQSPPGWLEARYRTGLINLRWIRPPHSPMRTSVNPLTARWVHTARASGETAARHRRNLLMHLPSQHKHDRCYSCSPAQHFNVERFKRWHGGLIRAFQGNWIRKLGWSCMVVF